MLEPIECISRPIVYVFHISDGQQQMPKWTAAPVQWPRRWSFWIPKFQDVVWEQSINSTGETRQVTFE